MANILYRTTNGAMEKRGAELESTKEVVEGKKNTFPVGLKRSYSYIKGTPLSASEIDTNFYQLSAETNHQGICETEGDAVEKTVQTTYFPLETGARVSIRFLSKNTAKKPTLTVYVPNIDDDGKYTETSVDLETSSKQKWIAYGPFPIYIDNTAMAETSATEQVSLVEDVWYDFIFDDFGKQDKYAADYKTTRAHRWKLITNNAVHKDGKEVISGLKLHENHIGITADSARLVIANSKIQRDLDGVIVNGTDTASGIIFGSGGLIDSTKTALTLKDSERVGRVAYRVPSSSAGYKQCLALSLRHTDDDKSYGAADGKWTSFQLRTVSRDNFESGYLYLEQNAGIPAGNFSPILTLDSRFNHVDGTSSRTKINVINILNTHSADHDSNVLGALQFGGGKQTTFITAGEVGSTSNLPTHVMDLMPKNSAVYGSLDANPPEPYGENIWLVADSHIVFRPTACGSDGSANEINQYMPTGWFSSEVEPKTETEAVNAHVSIFGFSLDAFDQFYKDNANTTSLKWSTAPAANSTVSW